jgi:Zn2+/Cd2+-exporting ATPase
VTRHDIDLTVAMSSAESCDDCLAEVRGELQRLAGIVSVTPELEQGRLRVRVSDQGPDRAAVTALVQRAGAQLHCAAHCPAAVHEHPPVDLRAPLPGESSAERRRLHVTGMDCADCAMKIERAVRRESGVQRADINFGAATLDVVWDPRLTSLTDLHGAVRRLGYDTVEGRAGSGRDLAPSPTGRAFWLRDRRARLTLLSGVLLVAGFVAALLAPALAPLLFGAAAVSGGVFAGRAAFGALRSRQVDMNVLMSVAVIGAVAIGEWSEAALVSFLFGLGTTLQAGTLERTRRAISGLMELAPDEAAVLRDGVETRMPTADVIVGAEIVVRPGERVPLDGTVTEGEAAVNQAQVTGESAPVTRRDGDTVFAGSIVEGGSLRLRTTAAADDTTVARIVHLVEEAQAQRAPLQTTVDRFAARYTPAVVALAAAVALLPPLFGAPFSEWLYRGLALLIISCPCALVISTPVSFLAALSRASRLGALVKGGASLEQAATIDALAIDKTGTLTHGHPRVTAVTALDGGTPGHVLAVAAACERLSEHALARAIVAAADGHAGHTHMSEARLDKQVVRLDGQVVRLDGQENRLDGQERRLDGQERRVDGQPDPLDGSDGCEGRGCGCDGGCDEGVRADAHDDHGDHGDHGGGLLPVSGFRSFAGLGVRADVDGRPCAVGRPALLGAAGDDPRLLAALAEAESGGATAVAVGDDRGPLGVIAVSDPVREQAAEAVRRLHALGVSPIVMLTGDNEKAAEAIARQTGVDLVEAGLLPADKIDAVRRLRETHGNVAMVGDGVNDAPALAAASLGVAMGAAGTDAALQTADIALMGDDLTTLPEVVALARRTQSVIKQNIAFSIAVKAVFLVLAPLGLTSLWLAVFADMGTSLLVTANGLRLTRGSAER